MNPGDVQAIVPLAILLVGAFLVYLVAYLITSRNEILALLTAVIFAVAWASLLYLGQVNDWRSRLGLPDLTWGDPDAHGVALRVDGGAVVISTVAMALGLCVALYCGRYLALDRRHQLTYPLLLLMVAGLQGTVTTNDLFSLYLFCELMSVTAYVLVAFRRHTDTAVEAGFKYLIIGSLGTLTVLMGLALIYRETGSLELRQLVTVSSPWMRAGLACVLGGLGLKSALVPGHTWLPDAHGRAPSSVSAMLSGIVIQSTFYALLKVSLGLGYPPHRLGTLLIALSVVNMTVGNGLALVQTHTKRLLAYSTIAQMGYIMFALGTGLRYDQPAAVQIGLFLLVAHAAMKSLAFLSKGVCHFYLGATRIDELRGTWQRLPLVAVTFSIALSGLAGIPPLAGFAGKWFIMTEVLQAGDVLAHAGLAIFLLNTLISLGYYLPVTVTLFTPTTDHSTPTPISAWMTIPLVTLSLLVLGLGIWPSPWLKWILQLADTTR